MKKRNLVVIAALSLLMMNTAMAQDTTFDTARLVPKLRSMLSKSMLDQTLDFNNTTGFVLEDVEPEGARFFWGGNSKKPSESADDMRQVHSLVILITPCSGVHDLNAKISSVAIWEVVSNDNVGRSGAGLEELLSLMNTPPGVVTPSTLRVPRVKNLHGPVFEYVRGDTTETLSFVNEGSALRVNWTSTNTSFCAK